jgi:hypothetical protein
LALALLAAAPLAGGCGRDLAVPDVRPPQLASVELVPLPGTAALAAAGSQVRAFTSELVRLRGTALGSTGTTTVLVGGQAAAVLSVERPAGAAQELLTLRLPALPARAKGLDVQVTTADGTATLSEAVVPLGPGRPESLLVRARTGLSPSVERFGVIGEYAYLLDSAHSLMIGVEASTGLFLPIAARTSGTASRVFGTDEGRPWTYDLGDRGEQASIHHFDFTNLPPTELCSSPLEAGATNKLVVQAAITPSGALIAIPKGDTKILLATVACTPVVTTLDVGGQSAVAGLVFASETTLLGFTGERPLRIELGAGGAAPQIFLGAPFPAADPNADPNRYLQSPVRVQPGQRRLAYVRYDGDLGFLSWPDQGGPPVFEAQTIFTFARPLDLAWDESGAHLLALDAVGTLTSFDAVTGQPVASVDLTGAESLARLEKGPAKGDLVVTKGSELSLVTSALSVLRTRPLKAYLPDDLSLALHTEGTAAAPEELLIVPTDLDAMAFGLAPLALRYLTQYPLQLLGVQGGGGAVIGWGQDPTDGTPFLSERRSGEWHPLPITPARAVVLAAAIVPASAAGPGLVACISQEPGAEPAGTLELLPLAGGAALGKVEYDDVTTARLLFRGRQLTVATGGPDGLVLDRFDAGALTGRQSLVLTYGPAVLEAGSTLTRVSGLFDSRALGGVLAIVESSGINGSDTGSPQAGAATLWTDGGARADAALTGAQAGAVALSADGRELLSASRGSDGTAPGLEGLELTGVSGNVLLTGPLRHQDVSARVTFAVPSPDGATYFVAFSKDDALGVVQ